VRRALAIVVLGLLAPMVQGALSAFVPTGWFPDAGLLLVMALGLAWPGAIAGALLATWVGFVSDLLSGSLVGQHALLWLCAFGVARVVSSHVNLYGAPPQMVLAAGLTTGAALAMSALTAFFSPDSVPGLASGQLLRQIAVNALAGPMVISAVAALIARLDEESGRRVLRLEPRRLGP
jgi:cell shape-determining protein MreD